MNLNAELVFPEKSRHFRIYVYVTSEFSCLDDVDNINNVYDVDNVNNVYDVDNINNVYDVENNNNVYDVDNINNVYAVDNVDDICNSCMRGIRERPTCLHNSNSSSNGKTNQINTKI